MDELNFVTASGVTGLIFQWDISESEYDAAGWVEKFGADIGVCVAPLPNGKGYVDLRQFAAVLVGN